MIKTFYVHDYVLVCGLGTIYIPGGPEGKSNLLKKYFISKLLGSNESHIIVFYTTRCRDEYWFKISIKPEGYQRKKLLNDLRAS